MSNLPAGVTFTAPITPRYAQILTPEAIAFLVGLHRAHNARRKELLAARATRQAALDAGIHPRLPPRDQAHPRQPNGPSPHSPPISSTAASRSPAPSTAR